MVILSIDTSCDETAVAVTDGRKVLSNVIYSQILLHKKWGGVVPSIAKRAHEERIDFVIEEVLRKWNQSTKIFSQGQLASRRTSGPVVPRSSSESEGSLRHSLAQTTDFRKIFVSLFQNIDCISVTQGPGLAVALEVGIKKAKELAKKYNKKLIAVNHMEGHIYSCFVQNSRGNPKIKFKFPYLALLISGGHTELVVFKDHLKYEVIGETIDDAAGEALDKAAKMLGLGYPGGPVIERLAREVKNVDNYKFPRPMLKSNDLNFSFSGLKTAFYYFLKKQKNPHKLNILASSFQEAVFDTLIKKTERAIEETKINNLIVGGGVIANLYLRKLLRNLTKKYYGEVLFPPFKYLTGDNAAMIGVAAYFKSEKGLFISDLDQLDRIPRLKL